MTFDPSTYDGLQQIQVELDALGTGVTVSSRGLPGCPACHAEIEYSACRPTRHPTAKAIAAVLDIIVAAHRHFDCTAAREDTT